MASAQWGELLLQIIVKRDQTPRVRTAAVRMLQALISCMPPRHLGGRALVSHFLRLAGMSTVPGLLLHGSERIGECR